MITPPSNVSNMAQKSEVVTVWESESLQELIDSESVKIIVIK